MNILACSGRGCYFFVYHPVYAEHKSVVVSLHVELKDGLTSYSVGDEVPVYYDGNISDADPATADTVYAITLIPPADWEENNHS